MKAFFCRLHGPRPTFPVAEPGATYGILILEVESETAARALLDADPVVEAQLGFRFEIHPMPRGVVHP